MPVPLTIEIVTKEIIAAAKERFEVSINDQPTSPLMQLVRDIEEKQVIRLRRISSQRHNWRTLLVAIINNNSGIEIAQKWSAAARELLLNNESADLYLLILSEGLISNEHCINIEADERYCRKYVLRPNESLVGLLNRCFLYQPDDDTQMGGFVDPLEEALQKTSDEHEWFDNKFQEQWKAAFLSNKSGIELAEMLFEHLQNI